ncbi:MULTISPECIES: NAD(P)H-dependent oxidoreductase [unclassified Carboxylicivirga]|uniref:glutathione-regulated potassium-efflux system oxidoreductase KefF n=1 Tax=Carboxylicivirga TaxID=1628153 RepID=UPI003D351E4C
MKKILIIYAHPIETKSRVNRRMIAAVESMSNVRVNKLYENYPDFFIDVKHEQSLLEEHDVVVWHHPMYWYSGPALLKEWFDLVLEHGFAYGKEGNFLKGKWAINCVTTGGRAASYQAGGVNRFPVRQFLLPFDQSATLCKMRYLSPYIVHGVHLLNENNIKEVVADYTRFISFLRDEEWQEEQINREDSFNIFMSRGKKQ